MGNFSQDLKIGEKAENFLIKELQEELPGLKSTQGNFPDYDLISDSGYTIEVKFDAISKTTGNVGFEYECNNHPSGLASTKAMEWIHVYYLIDKWVYSRIRTNNLKSFIKDNWNELKKVKGGDRNSSKLILIDSEDFANNFPYKEIS